MNTINVYVALCLIAWAVGTIGMVTWARSQAKMGKALPARLWWLERLVRNLFN